MRLRFWSLLVIPVATSLVLIACGSSNTSNGGAPDGGGDSTITFLEGGFGGDTSMEASGPCKPKTCASAGYNCGKNADGCGNIIDCGACMSPEFCGGAGFR